MDKLNLTVSTRSGEFAPNIIRGQGKMPGIVYGKEENPIMVSVPTPDFKKIYKEAGETTIINLIIDDKDNDPIMTLIKDTQVSPDRGEFLHVDFYRIRVGEKLRVTMPLKFVGEAPAVKDFGGILITNKNEVEIECLPKDLPHEIVVDLSNLENIDTAIIVKDIKISDAIAILDNEEESVVSVAPPQEEEEEIVSEEDAIASVETTEEKVEGDKEGSVEESAPKDSEDKKEDKES